MQALLTTQACSRGRRGPHAAWIEGFSRGPSVRVVRWLRELPFRAHNVQLPKGAVPMAHSASPGGATDETPWAPSPSRATIPPLRSPISGGLALDEATPEMGNPLLQGLPSGVLDDVSHEGVLYAELRACPSSPSTCSSSNSSPTITSHSILSFLNCSFNLFKSVPTQRLSWSRCSTSKAQGRFSLDTALVEATEMTQLHVNRESYVFPWADAHDTGTF